MAVEGWYPDSEDPSLVRWWDGDAWTDHTRLYSEVVEPNPAAVPVAGAAATVAAETSAEPKRPKLPRRSRDTAAAATASAGAAAAAKWTAKTELEGGENYTVKPTTDRRVPIAAAAALLVAAGIVIAFAVSGANDQNKVRVEGTSVKRTTTTTASTTTEASVGIIDAATTIAEQPTLPPATAAPDVAPTIAPARSITPTTVRTATAKPPTTKPVATTTQPPAVRFIKGAVELLDQVWFTGQTGPAAGSACTPRTSVATVVKITDPTGAVLSTAPFAAGTIRYAVKSSAAERAQRITLIGTIFDDRITAAEAGGDAALVAQLKAQKSQAVLDEQQHPENATQPFEGKAFQAAYCHMEFASGPMPDRASYAATAAPAAPLTLTRAALIAKNWVIELAL